MFETILRKIFTKYNTENISDDDLKYNHYLEKENDELILENKKYKEVIEKVKDYINDVSIHTDNYFDLNNNLWIREVELLDILKEVD